MLVDVLIAKVFEIVLLGGVEATAERSIAALQLFLSGDLKNLFDDHTLRRYAKFKAVVPSLNIRDALLSQLQSHQTNKDSVAHRGLMRTGLLGVKCMSCPTQDWSSCISKSVSRS